MDNIENCMPQQPRYSLQKMHMNVQMEAGCLQLQHNTASWVDDAPSDDDGDNHFGKSNQATSRVSNNKNWLIPIFANNLFPINF